MLATIDPTTNKCIRGCCFSATIPLALPSYTLLGPIARGSESTVHEAYLSDGRRVAAKKPFLPTSDHLDKFHRELQLLWYFYLVLIDFILYFLVLSSLFLIDFGMGKCSSLDHPGLAKMLAAHAKPPNYMFFFEMYESRNLAEKLHVEEWNPEIECALGLAIQIGNIGIKDYIFTQQLGNLGQHSKCHTW